MGKNGKDALICASELSTPKALFIVLPTEKQNKTLPYVGSSHLRGIPCLGNQHESWIQMRSTIGPPKSPSTHMVKEFLRSAFSEHDLLNLCSVQLHILGPRPDQIYINTYILCIFSCPSWKFASFKRPTPAWKTHPSWKCQTFSGPPPCVQREGNISCYMTGLPLSFCAYLYRYCEYCVHVHPSTTAGSLSNPLFRHVLKKNCALCTGLSLRNVVRLC